MQSVTDLENTLIELQWMINNTINPIFADLQNSSQALDPVILSHNTMIDKINEMILFLNSGVIQGLKGDTGLVPLSYAFTLSDVSTVLTSAIIINDLSLTLEANSIYEIDSFITFTSSSVTNGLRLGLITPLNSLNLVEIVIPISQVASSTQLRKISPIYDQVGNFTEVLGTGVGNSNIIHTATIRGYIKTGSTAGDCNISFASEVANSTTTIKTNSFLLLKKIA